MSFVAPIVGILTNKTNIENIMIVNNTIIVAPATIDNIEEMPGVHFFGAVKNHLLMKK